VLWSAVMEDSDLLDGQEVEDQLRNMLVAVMIPGQSFNAAHATPDAHSTLSGQIV
jgi:hypothetical protein